MFQLKTVPSHTYRSCSGCPHHKRHLAKSGKNPIYANNCEHPEIDQRFSDLLFGNIGDTDQTPNWCPFIKKPNYEPPSNQPNPYAPLQTKIDEDLEKLKKELSPEDYDRIEGLTKSHFKSQYGVDLKIS